MIAAAKSFLDGVLPLADGSWAEAMRIGNTPPALANPGQFLGSREKLFYYENNGLKVVLEFDDTTEIGASDPLGLSDVRLESAMSAIMDCEDSVAAVDADDKVLAYSNWLGLMDGSLTEDVTKGGKTHTRALNDDLTFDGPDGEVTLKGRALMLVRNVGHLMTNPAILLPDGSEVPEADGCRGYDALRHARSEARER